MRNLEGVVVVDATPRMLLVESDADALRELVDTLPRWIVAPEQSFGVPDPRPTVEGPPE